MRESAIGGAALPGLSQFSVGSAGGVAAAYDKAQQFLPHHPKSFPTTHPHSTPLLVPWDAGTNRCARQVSSTSTSREMEVQRSIGKKILAVVAGVGLASAGLVGVAPAAQAGEEACGSASVVDKPASQAKEGAETLARDACKAAGKPVVRVDSSASEYDAFNWLGTATAFAFVDGPPTPPPPPCWSGEAGNNCPVGGALRFTAPRYAMVGVPVTMYAYASWRPDANAPSQPTNGTAVIRVDGEDYSGVEFKDGVAEWRFIPQTEGMKEFTASGVVFSGLSGANAYIDTVPARTYVLEYDPAAYAKALKKKAVEVGDTYVITDPNQAKSYLKGRYDWSVAKKSDDVCAVYETKKGAVKAKFTDSGKCTVIWMDKESEEKGKYTFIAKK